MQQYIPSGINQSAVLKRRSVCSAVVGDKCLIVNSASFVWSNKNKRVPFCRLVMPFCITSHNKNLATHFYCSGHESLVEWLKMRNERNTKLSSALFWKSLWMIVFQQQPCAFLNRAETVPPAGTRLMQELFIGAGRGRRTRYQAAPRPVFSSRPPFLKWQCVFDHLSETLKLYITQVVVESAVGDRKLDAAADRQVFFRVFSHECGVAHCISSASSIAWKTWVLR